MDIATILSRNDGFATRATLYAAGVSKRQLQRELAAGTLVAFSRDVVGSPRAPAVFQRAVRMKCRLACVTAAKAVGLWVLKADDFHVVPRVNNSHAAANRAHPAPRILAATWAEIRSHLGHGAHRTGWA